MVDHRWVLAAFALGLFAGWFTTWVSTKMLVAHYRSEVLYWRGMWRKADKRLTQLLLQYMRDPSSETEAYFEGNEVEEPKDEEPKDEEPSPEPPVDRATVIERLIRDRDATDQDPPED